MYKAYRVVLPNTVMLTLSLMLMPVTNSLFDDADDDADVPSSPESSYVVQQLWMFIM